MTNFALLIMCSVSQNKMPVKKDVGSDKNAKPKRDTCRRCTVVFQGFKYHRNKVLSTVPVDASTNTQAKNQ